MLPPRNTSRPSVCTAPLVTPTPSPSAEASERACGTLVSFIQLHKRCIERLPNKLDGRLLQYPYDISLFHLALNTWAFNSFIITLNGPRPIYLTIPTKNFKPHWKCSHFVFDIPVLRWRLLSWTSTRNSSYTYLQLNNGLCLELTVLCI
jgi:hypothetical protein